MSAPLPDLAPPTSSASRERMVPGGVVIATINRDEGDTGVHAHTRSLLAGLHVSGNHASVISAFGGSPIWRGVFAVRRVLLDAINKSWSTRWHRYWHRVALQRNLENRFKPFPPGAVIAQCPLSAQAAMNVREKLQQRYPIVAVCHFNHSEATEYREKGELADEQAFQNILQLERDVLSSVDAVVYVSAFARDVVEQQRKITPKRSAVIWNGIAESSAEAVDRRSLKLTADDVVLINVGTLEGRKNQLGLLDLFAIVAARVPSVKLVLVGDGPDREAIANRVRKLKLDDHVRLPGFRRDVPALLAASDAYIHFAKLENCPVVLLEAARAGLPIATVPAGGAAEVLSALGAGVLLDPIDLQKSADELMPMLERASVRREMGAAVRDGFEASFTVEAMVDRYLDVIQQHVPASMASVVRL